MRRIVALLALLFLGSASLAQNVEATIVAKCLTDWPGDSGMQAFCERNQRQAVLELQQMIAANGGIPVAPFQIAYEGCVLDWPGDFAMQAFCLRNQIDGFADVARGPTSPMVMITNEEAHIIEQKCAHEWPRDFSMQAFCQKQQAEGLAFLRNRPDTIPDSTWSRLISACAVSWRNDYQMQAFCVRQSL